jgi:glutathione S-transferase
MTEPVLWQFRHSHFNEKARWALDLKGVRHVRRSLVPAFHIPRVMWMTGQKSVPVLVLGDRTIHDSTRIIAALEEAYPEPPLYPADDAARRRALELEDFFDEQLGPQLRRAVFHALLADADYSAALFTTGTGPGTRAAYRGFFPAIRALMKLDMAIDAAGAERGRAKIAAALDRIEAELQPSGYLAGDRFSVADLTAAALFSPLVQPPEYPYALPAGSPPAAVRELQDQFTSRPAFAWVREMYRRHRGASMEVAA